MKELVSWSSNVSYVCRVLIFISADDDRIRSQLREGETEWEGALAELLYEPCLKFGLLVFLLLWRINLDPVQHQLLLEGEAQGLVLLPAMSEGDHQLDKYPPTLGGHYTILIRTVLFDKVTTKLGYDL